MTDDFNLVKERYRSDSFNMEFEGLHKFDSSDFNNTLLREFSNNYE